MFKVLRLKPNRQRIKAIVRIFVLYFDQSILGNVKDNVECHSYIQLRRAGHEHQLRQETPIESNKISHH